jgi:signal transduction histidine kinase/FixJ family two-component response regulator
VLRLVLASKQEMVLFWGPDHVSLYNDAYSAAIGDKHPAALGRPAGDHWAELWGVLHALLEQVMISGESFVVKDHPFPMTRHGFLEQTYFNVSGDPILLDDGSVGGVLCVVTETTGRVVSERRLRTLGELGVRTAGVSVVDQVIRMAATVLAKNPDDLPFAQIYLRTGTAELRCVAAVTGARPVRSGRKTVDLTSDSPMAAALAQVLDQGETVECTAAASLTASGCGPVLALPLTSGGEVVGVLVAATNPMYELRGPYQEFLDLVAGTLSPAIVNAVARHQEQQRSKFLTELDRAKTDLFSNVSHELRTPLTLVSAPVEEALADEEQPLPPRQRERIQLVRRNAARLRRLLNNVLDFTRIESGGLRAEPAATDLPELTRGIAAAFAPAVQRGGLEFVVECMTLTRTAYVDPEMWERIVLNLLSNALKFTLRGQIRLSLSGDDEHITLAVSDTGVGIPPDQVPLVFNRFHRVRGAGGRTEEGAGIGLALVHELVRLHGGTVELDSELKRGSTFTVTVPYGAESDSPVTNRPDWVREVHVVEALGWTATKDSPEIPVTPAGETKGATVLVVEDNADLRSYLAQLLSPYWTIRTAADGELALGVLRRTRPDLVLTDIVMPHLDGYGLLSALRSDPRTQDIPVILLSAQAGEKAAVEGLRAGADDYLVKPFSSQQLVARVRSNIELASLRHHHAEREAAHARFAARLAGATEVDEVLTIGATEIGAPWRLPDVIVVTWDEAGRRSVFAPAHEHTWDALPPAVRHSLEELRQSLGPVVRPSSARTGDRSAGGMGAASDVLGGRAAVWLEFDPPEAVSSADRNLLQALCGQFGLALSRARSFEQQRTVAVTLQRAILGPSRLPDGFAARYEPALQPLEVGGDWYDVVDLGDGRMGLVVGDCVGRGLPAAAIMGQLRSACRALLLQANSPARTLGALDDFAALIPDALCTTVLCAVLDRNTDELVYSSAGHPPGLLIHADGLRTMLDQATAVPLAVGKPALRPEATLRLTPDSTLLLYTDGLVERRDELIDEGVDRAATVVAASRELPEEALADRVVGSLRPKPGHDDVVVLVYRHVVAAKRRFTWSFPADPTELAHARHALRQWLSDAGVDDDVTDRAVLAAAEAGTNSVEHGYQFDRRRMVHTMAVLDDDAVHIVVADNGTWRSPAGVAGDRGRGIPLMRGVSDVFAVDTSLLGTTVSFTVRLDQGSA